jgi:hypothetical protein
LIERDVIRPCPYIQDALLARGNAVEQAEQQSCWLTGFESRLVRELVLNQHCNVMDEAGKLAGK